jgi:hypothetical protein
VRLDEPTLTAHGLTEAASDPGRGEHARGGSHVARATGRGVRRERRRFLRVDERGEGEGAEDHEYGEGPHACRSLSEGSDFLHDIDATRLVQVISAAII